jgi:transposase
VCDNMRKKEYDNLEKRIEDIQEQLKLEKNVRLYQRYQVIQLHLQGHRNREIAKMVNLNENTIGTYIKKYQKQGIEGLDMSYSPGAPRKLTPEQEARVREVLLHQTPKEVGLNTQMNWTSPLVCEWIQREFQVQYADRGALHLLHRLGFSHTRPTYTLAKADPDKQAAFRDTFQDVKKN